VLKADNLPASCAVVTKSGNLNFLEPSGPVQACNGVDLPFTLFKSTTRMGTEQYGFSEKREDRGNGRGLKI